MSTREEFGVKMLAEIASGGSGAEDEVRIQAAQVLIGLDRDSDRDYIGAWHEVSIRALTVFFLKVVVAGAPAMLLTICLYIFMVIFTQVAPNLLGL